VKAQVDVPFWPAWQSGKLPEDPTRMAHELAKRFENVVKDDMMIHPFFVCAIGGKTRAFIGHAPQHSPSSKVCSCVSVEDGESN